MEPSLATKLPELVRDSRLETILSADNTVHVYYDRPGRRAEPRREEWRKERVIGSGGNGVVWLEKRLAANSKDGKGDQARFRAVKQITSAGSRSVLEICKSELEALAKFSTRKYTAWFVQSFGWYEDSGLLSIAMEYCLLGDLQNFLIEHTRAPESDTHEIIGQVVGGLRYMHNEGFAHRDLKPGNILIMSRPPEHEWWVKIGDMGLSKRIEEVGAATTSLKGTPGFFAPEQLGLGGIDPKTADPFKSDIWCVGEMTFRMLCGEPVFPSPDNLSEYYKGTVTFPNQRLYEIEVSEPAISFIASAMLAEPQSRLDARQALNHEWLGVIHKDPAVGEIDSSHPVPGPSCSEPNRGPYLGTEPSGTWSTISLSLRPSGTESTIRPPSMEAHQNSEVAPWPPLSPHAAESDRDSETPSSSQTIRQTTRRQVFKSMMEAKDHNHNPRSSNRTGTQQRTSGYDGNAGMDFCNRDREESCSPNRTRTATANPPIFHVTEAGDDNEDTISDRSNIELETEGTAEAMAKLTEIGNYFDNELQPRALYYLNSTIWDPIQRAAEYRWLSNVAMCEILLKADEININGSSKLRAQRKALADRVNAILDDLETAKKEFDEQEKKQRGAEWSEGGIRYSQRFQQGSSGEEEEWVREREKQRVRFAREVKERKEEKERIAREREEREKEKHKEKKAYNDREKERGNERKSSATAEKDRSRRPLIIGEDTSRVSRCSGNIESALRYLARSNAKPPTAFARSHTYSEGSKRFNYPEVPTPLAQCNQPFAPLLQVVEPEEISEEDDY